MTDGSLTKARVIARHVENQVLHPGEARWSS